jgi:hypothetical protein
MRRAGLLALGLLLSACAWSQSGVNEEGRPVRHSAHPAPAHKAHPAAAHKSNQSDRPLTPREKQLRKRQKAEAKREKKLAKKQAKEARRNSRRTLQSH